MKLIFACAFTLLSLVGICTTIARQGKPRKPITPTEVITTLIMSGLWNVGIWWLVMS